MLGEQTWVGCNQPYPLLPLLQPTQETSEAQISLTCSASSKSGHQPPACSGNRAEGGVQWEKGKRCRWARRRHRVEVCGGRKERTGVCMEDRPRAFWPRRGRSLPASSAEQMFPYLPRSSFQQVCLSSGCQQRHGLLP